MERARDIARRVRSAADAFVALRPELDAGEPWPLAADFGPGPEASWGPREVLAHVAEMLPFWLGEAERIVAGSESAVPFGRTQLDPVRMAAIEHDRTLPIGDLVSRIDRSAASYELVLGDWDDRALERQGLHASLGELSVGDLLERFAAAHAEDHVSQLRETIERHG